MAAGVGRPRTRDKGEPRQYVGFPVPVSLKAQLEAAAKANGRSLSAEAAARLEDSFAELPYPPEVAALVELVARVMDETGNTITRANSLATGGPVGPWYDDGYGYDQGFKAALKVLIQARPPGSREPHGLFAALRGLPIGPANLEHQVGKRTADGILEAVRGRQQGAYRWPRARRVLERLGSIGKRLAKQPVPDSVMVAAFASTSHREP